MEPTDKVLYIVYAIAVYVLIMDLLVWRQG